jgi:hypothetical protein
VQNCDESFLISAKKKVGIWQNSNRAAHKFVLYLLEKKAIVKN